MRCKFFVIGNKFITRRLTRSNLVIADVAVIGRELVPELETGRNLGAAISDALPLEAARSANHILRQTQGRLRGSIMHQLPNFSKIGQCI